jgi:hypothetical protein
MNNVTQGIARTFTWENRLGWPFAREKAPGFIN